MVPKRGTRQKYIGIQGWPLVVTNYGNSIFIWLVIVKVVKIFTAMLKYSQLANKVKLVARTHTVHVLDLHSVYL